MLTLLRKDLYKSYYRIFDHRIFVNGEIEQFVHNFEGKRNESEVEKLFAITETVGELKYGLSERCLTLGTKNLNDINTVSKDLLRELEVALAKVNEERPPSEFLLRSRQDRETRKLNFVKDIEHGYQRVDNSFEEKEEEIAELYSDLQLKLNIPK